MDKDLESQHPQSWNIGPAARCKNDGSEVGNHLGHPEMDEKRIGKGFTPGSRNLGVNKIVILKFAEEPIVIYSKLH
jgi:hypothetical protein